MVDRHGSRLRIRQCSLRLSFFLVMIQGLENLLDEARLRQRSGKFDAIIDDSFRHPLNMIMLREVHELRRFYHISSNMLVFDG